MMFGLKYRIYVLACLTHANNLEKQLSGINKFYPIKMNLNNGPQIFTYKKKRDKICKCRKYDVFNPRLD